jgi:hypothetical protein
MKRRAKFGCLAAIALIVALIAFVVSQGFWLVLRSPAPKSARKPGSAPPPLKSEPKPRSIAVRALLFAGADAAGLRRLRLFAVQQPAVTAV